MKNYSPFVIFISTNILSTMTSSNASSNCCICLENINKNDQRVLPCNHVFHNECYLKWESHSNSGTTACPLCREEHRNSDESNNTRNQRAFNNRRSTRFNHYMRRRRNRMQRARMRGFDIFRNLDPSYYHDNMDMDIDIDTTFKSALVAFITILVVAIPMGITLFMHETCVCKLNWNEGQLSMTQHNWLGGTTVYERPQICTMWC